MYLIVWGMKWGIKDALSVLDTVKVVDDVMLIRYNIKKSLGCSKKTS